MTVTESRKAISAALGLRNQEQVIADVKGAVAREVEHLNPGATIHFTEYFNHVAVPDMTVRWPGGERPLFLRYSLESAAVADDAHLLNSRAPILMAVTGDQSAPAREEELEEATDTLTTHLDNVARLNESEPSSPVESLLRNSVLSSGRGLLDEAQTARMVELPTHSSTEAASIVVDIAEKILDASAQRQIRRAQEIISWATGSGTLPPASESLTEAEVRALVPHLLSIEEARDNKDFWEFLGSILTFGDLLDLGPWIEQHDVTPLVQWGSATWVVRHAQISERLHIAEEEHLRTWSLKGRKLIGLGKNERVTLAEDGRRLTTRSSASSPPAWTHLRERLAPLPVNGVNLTGLNRNLSISGPERRTAGVMEDAIRLTDSIDESFGVTEVTIMDKTPENEYTINVELRESVTHAIPHAPLHALVQTAFAVLGSASQPGDLPALSTDPDTPKDPL